ncbi:glycosyltransferase [Flavobacterium sp. ANB]|uniref:glycosyltransferase n=1 Tax=unclassified Flavobacterium TaxID=196869 RepID=UPI0012B92928|nr:MULTISPECIES: glycosyltransferase [unclassified Flavobacterium]MBF4518056.1 glycosyltransferase [Flavobacterium sp. ANB]MTD71200.1 glycosyltransferase [Flavobacterium sp. LC2016-13]
MKILRVISSMHPRKGGPCQGIRNAIPYFKKLGISNDVVCMDDENSDYNIKDDFTIYKVGTGKTSYQYQPKLLKWLEDHILEYDFICVHGLWQYHNLAVHTVIKTLNNKNQNVPKVIIMPHGMLDPYFQKARERKWKALRNEMVWSFIEKKCINHANAIFYTCKEEMRLAATTFKNYRPKKVFNVGYGIQLPPEKNVDFNAAFYKTCPAVENKKYVLFLSRIHHKKGVDLLINAYNEICRENSDLPDLVIAGPIDSDYAQEMIKLASVNQKIHFSGMLKGDAKWAAFYNCEAYVLPSHQENFGIAIVEAMGCKKPVLITKNVNIWSEILKGEGGWIVDLEEKNGLKSALAEIVNESHENLSAKGRKAFETYQNHFDIETCANKFIQTLKSI